MDTPSLAKHKRKLLVSSDDEVLKKVKDEPRDSRESRESSHQVIEAK